MQRQAEEGVTEFNEAERAAIASIEIFTNLTEPVIIQSATSTIAVLPITADMSTSISISTPTDEAGFVAEVTIPKPINVLLIGAGCGAPLVALDRLGV